MPSSDVSLCQIEVTINLNRIEIEKNLSKQKKHNHYGHTSKTSRRYSLRMKRGEGKGKAARAYNGIAVQRPTLPVYIQLNGEEQRRRLFNNTSQCIYQREIRHYCNTSLTFLLLRNHKRPILDESWEVMTIQLAQDIMMINQQSYLL